MYVIIMSANKSKNKKGILTLYNSSTGRLNLNELIKRLIPTGGVM
jgi:hypothetical protein